MIKLKVCSNTYSVERGVVASIKLGSTCDVRYLLCINDLEIDITDRIVSNTQTNITCLKTTVDFSLNSGERFENIEMCIGTLSR